MGNTASEYEESRVLVERAKDGDSSAIRDLLVLHRDRLKSMIIAYLDPRVRSRVDASDVLQETLTQAAVRLPDFAAEATAFYPWLRGLAKQRIFTIHREHIYTGKRSVNREQSRKLHATDESVCSVADRLKDPASSPISAAIKNERKELLQQELLKLSVDEKELVMMRFVEQMSVAEIAQSLEISEAAVKSRLLRTLEKLNRRIKHRFL